MNTTRKLLSENLLLMVFLTFPVALSLLISGCQSSDVNHSDVELEWEISPKPPAVGLATINFTLRDSTGLLINGAEVELEGNMSHPGMQPIFATAEEIEPGRYVADVNLTMGGDWYFLIESILPDDRVIKRQININGVRSQ